jgi:hypothetical protein
MRGGNYLFTHLSGTGLEIVHAGETKGPSIAFVSTRKWHVAKKSLARQRLIFALILIRGPVGRRGTISPKNHRPSMNADLLEEQAS